MSTDLDPKDYVTAVDYLTALAAQHPGDPEVAAALAEAIARQDAAIDEHEAWVSSPEVQRELAKQRVARYHARRATFEVGEAEPRSGQQLIVETEDGWRYVKSVEIDPDEDYTGTWAEPPVIRVAELARLGDRDVERLRRAGDLKPPRDTDVSRILGITRLRALAVIESVTSYKLDSHGDPVYDDKDDPVAAGSLIAWHVYNPGTWEHVQDSTEQSRERRRTRPGRPPRTRAASDYRAKLAAAHGKGARTTGDFQEALGASRNTARAALEAAGWAEVGGGPGKRSTWEPPEAASDADDLSTEDDG